MIEKNHYITLLKEHSSNRFSKCSMVKSLKTRLKARLNQVSTLWIFPAIKNTCKYHQNFLKCHLVTCSIKWQTQIVTKFGVGLLIKTSSNRSTIPYRQSQALAHTCRMKRLQMRYLTR